MQKKIAILTISDLVHEANLHRKVMTLVENNFEVVLFAVYHPHLDKGLWKNVRLHLIRLTAANTMLRFFQFFYKSLFWLLRQKADLFISYDALPLLPLRIKKIFQKCKYIYDSVELFLGINSLVNRPVRRKFWYFYEKWGISKAESSFTVCELDAIYLQKTYPFISFPRFVRNIPVSIILPSNNYLREEFHISPETKIGIYQGKVFKGRGLEYLIQAISGVKNFIMFIIGDGPLKPELIQMAKELKIEYQVRFVDAVPFNKLAKYTTSADIGFTTISGTGQSYIHALPNKLFEYIQAGIPVIGSNYPEIRKIIERKKIGYTVQPDSVPEIKQAILNMLDEKKYRAFVENLNIIKDKYTWQKESKIYLEIIQYALISAENG